MIDIPLLDALPASALPRPAAPADDLAAVARVAKALSDPKRLGILGWLSGGEQCVCDLCDTSGLSQPLLSFHLRVLKEAGLVTDRRNGRWVHYRLSPGGGDAAQAFLERLAEASTRSGSEIVCC